MALFDWVVIGLYFLLIFGVAIYATIRERQDKGSSADYFLAGRNVGWFVVGASLFASNIGSEHLVGLAGTGADSGVAVGQFEVLASLILIILAWVFVPFYLRSGVYTMPEFLEKRYSPAARWYLAVISIVGYVLTKISVTIMAGGIVFEAVLGLNFWTGAIVVVVATGIYTIFGGLRAVLYTDLVQTFVLIGGSIAVTLIGLSKLGGWDEMVATAGPSFMDMWRPASDPDFPWTGIVFGAPILGVWYWCTDQFIVQRVLAARGIDHARRGALFGGLLKLLPVLIFVIPGIIAYSLAQKNQLVLADSDSALPSMISQLLPVGVRGLVVAGLLAALMSSLSSVYNSCSTLVTWDIYKKINPAASEKKLVLVGQITTVALVILGLVWTQYMKLISEQLFTYLQSVQAYISPPIAAVFLLGVFWKRLNAQGAIASLGVGFVLGMGRLAAEMGKASLDEGWLLRMVEVNFLHFAILLFAICSAVLIVVSMITPAQDDETLAGLTMATADAGGTILSSDPAWRRKDVLLTFVIVAGVALTWIYFSG
jgi:SSS family solute:Na+ symporter